MNKQFRNRLNQLRPSPAVFKEIDRITGRKRALDQISAPIIHKNIPHYSTQEKLSAFEKFYKNLYSRNIPQFNSELCLEVLTRNSSFLAWNSNTVLTEFSHNNNPSSTFAEEFASTELIESIILNLNNKKSSGLPTIPQFLTPIINNCIYNGYFPTFWKKAKLIPIKKKSNCNDKASCQI